MFRIRNIALLLTLALPAAAVAQAPNLSGTWVLQTDKSDFGMMPGPTSRTDVITHAEPNLTIKRTIESEQTGKVSSDLVYAVDGKEWKNKTSDGTEITSTLKWDGAVLVVTSQISTPNGDATITDRFSLSADGKTLTQDRAISVQGQELTQKMVLAKQ
jgi:hypothetical protein